MKNPGKQDVAAYLESKGVSFKSSGYSQFVLDECPFCSRENKFYIDQERGMYYCHSAHCEESGNLYTLKQHFGDVLEVTEIKDTIEEQEDSIVPTKDVMKWHQELKDDEEVKQWLYARRINDDSIQKFFLGVKIEASGKWLAIPYFKDGHCVNVKFRSLPPQEKTFKWLPGHDRPLFNIDNLDPDGVVYLTEGELDTIILVQEGFLQVTSVPSGVRSFQPEHYDSLTAKDKIILLFDNDTAGQQEVKKLAIRLDVGRCYNVKLPAKDITDVFLAGFTGEQLNRLIESTPPVGKSAIVSWSDAAKELLRKRLDLREDSVEGSLSYPWEKLTEVAGPMEPGGLVALTATPGIGKTTFALNVSRFLAEEGVPCLMICVEMTPIQLIQRIISDVLETKQEDITVTQLADCSEKLKNLPAYFVRNQADMTLEKVVDTIKYMHSRTGTRFVVFDNLHFLCRDIDRENELVGLATKAFKTLATELDITIMIVVHPKKQGYIGPMKLGDIKGSSSIQQDTEVIIALFRSPALGNVSEIGKNADMVLLPTYEAKTTVSILKSRFTAGGKMALNFRGELSRFEEYKKK